MPASSGTWGAALDGAPPSDSISTATSSSPARKCADSRMFGMRYRSTRFADSSRSHAPAAVACSGRAFDPHSATTMRRFPSASASAASSPYTASRSDPARRKIGSRRSGSRAAATARATSAIAAPAASLIASAESPRRAALARMPRIAAALTGRSAALAAQRTRSGAIATARSASTAVSGVVRRRVGLPSLAPRLVMSRG